MTVDLVSARGFKSPLVCVCAGSEFLLPVRGFFCLLCEDFFGDAICAEEHVTRHAHNEKYKVSDRTGVRGEELQS